MLKVGLPERFELVLLYILDLLAAVSGRALAFSTGWLPLWFSLYCY